MPESRETPVRNSIADCRISSGRSKALQFTDEHGHVADGAKMTGAVQRHLAGREEVGNRLRVQTRQVSGHHVRSRRAVMDLNRAEPVEDSGFNIAHGAPEKQAEKDSK